MSRKPVLHYDWSSGRWGWWLVRNSPPEHDPDWDWMREQEEMKDLQGEIEMARDYGDFDPGYPRWQPGVQP